jgi:hypothetical protein
MARQTNGDARVFVSIQGPLIGAVWRTDTEYGRRFSVDIKRRLASRKDLAVVDSFTEAEIPGVIELLRQCHRFIRRKERKHKFSTNS